MSWLSVLGKVAGTGLSVAGSLLNSRAGSGTSTQRSATSQMQFDPFTLELMRSLQGQGADVLGQYMQNPWAAGFFNQQQARASEGIGQRADVQRRNLLNPAFMSAGAASNPSAFLASEMAAVGRGASRERAQSFTDLLLGAENLRRGAAGQALGYRPLQTGSQTTESGTSQQKNGSLWGNILGLAGAGLGAWAGGGGGGAVGLPSGDLNIGGILSGTGQAGMASRFPGYFG